MRSSAIRTPVGGIRVEGHGGSLLIRGRTLHGIRTRLLHRFCRGPRDRSHRKSGRVWVRTPDTEKTASDKEFRPLCQEIWSS